MDLMPELEVQRVILSMALQSVNDKVLLSDNCTYETISTDSCASPEMVGGGGVGGFQKRGYLVDNGLAEFLSIRDLQLVSELSRDVVNTVSKIHTIHNRNSITKTEVSYLVSKIKQGLDRFVPEENKEAFIKWLINEIPCAEKGPSS